MWRFGFDSLNLRDVVSRFLIIGSLAGGRAVESFGRSAALKGFEVALPVFPGERFFSSSLPAMINFPG